MIGLLRRFFFLNPRIFVRVIVSRLCPKDFGLPEDIENCYFRMTPEKCSECWKKALKKYFAEVR